MHLQSDEARGVLRIEHVRGRNAVDPRTDAVADRLDAHLVPVAVAESPLRGGIGRQRVEPAEARLIVDTARPRARRRIDLVLIAPHATVGEVAAELDARIQPFVDAEQHLQDEVAVLFVRAQEGVRSARPADTLDGPVDDPVLRRPADPCPAFQVLAVEERLPLGLCSDEGAGPQ